MAEVDGWLAVSLSHASRKSHTPRQIQNAMNKFDIRSPRYLKEKVGYTMIHRWIRGMRGRPKACEQCGKLNHESGRSRIEWATKSGKYQRDISDWIPLCRSCHMKYDKIDRSAIQKKLWQNPSYRQHMVEVHKKPKTTNQ